MTAFEELERGNIVRDFLSVVDLLEDPQLVQLYAYLAREGKATIQNVMDDLAFAQGTVYPYVNRLVNAGIVVVVHDEQLRQYITREFDMILQALRPVVHKHYEIGEGLHPDTEEGANV